MMEMTREMAIGKIHRAVVTGADLHYVGSITVDEDLLDAANIVPGQKVDIVDVNNGERLSTYTIAGERGSGTIQLNGAAAHKVSVGDLVIIMAYAQVPESLVRTVKPSVVFVDGSNRIVSAGNHAGTVPEDSERARELGLEIDWVGAETSTPLGGCYNLMLSRVEADYIAKMDDDDLYGDHYLFESLAAADYARAEVVGKHAHYLHLTGPDLTVLRFADWEHRYTTFVSGPTLVARADLAREVTFPETTTGEDTGFLNDCARAGARIYSASRFGFVQRRGTTFGHTWDISNAEVLATSTISQRGPPHEMEMPTS